MPSSTSLPDATSQDEHDRARWRWGVYGLLIVIACSAATARDMRVESSDRKHPSPFLSANDRSRWTTIRALVDDGTYAIDDIVYDEKGNRIRGWHTIDMVRHKGPDGREHYYSSKPTLLPTLLAGEYWLVQQLTGATLKEQTFYVARIMLVLTNVLPFALSLWLLARLVDRVGATDYGRMFVMGTAAFGTFLTTFSITLNNHITAAICATITLCVAWPIWRDESRAWWRFLVAGLFAAFTAANELPALSFFCLVGATLLWKAPARTLAGFLPAAALVAAAAFGTNFLAHGHWKTAYAHRSDGPVVSTVDAAWATALDAGRLPDDIRTAVSNAGINISNEATIEPRRPGQRWVLWDSPTQTRLALNQVADAAQPQIEIREWDNWYDYEGTYWTPDRLTGVDRGERSPLVYTFHALVGHHGLFSLTPVWILSFAGLFVWLRRGDSMLRVFAASVLLLSVVVLTFYLTRPQIDRNYGGVTSGLRWMFWFTPLWLLTMAPAADWLARRRWAQVMALIALAISVFSVHYAAMNPWSHPWLFDYWTQLGWIRY